MRPSKKYRKSVQDNVQGDIYLASKLPAGLQGEIISFAGAAAALSLSTSNRQWRSNVAKEDSVWEIFCAALWADKLYVPELFRQQPTMKSYVGSIVDSRRCVFGEEDLGLRPVDELCLQHFHFRFKRGAGVYWTSKDPSWRDEPPMYRRFLPDGTMATKPPPPPRQLPSGTTSAGVSSGLMMRELPDCVVVPLLDPLETDPDLEGLSQSIRWRFTKSKQGRPGQYVMLNRWPSYRIRRTIRWGWSLEAYWVKYMSCCEETAMLGDEWYRDLSDTES